MTLDDKMSALNQEFRECRTSFNEKLETLGEKSFRLELDTIGKLTRLETQLESVSTSLSTFVSQHQFAPVKLIVYGGAAGVLTTVLGAILAKILHL